MAQKHKDFIECQGDCIFVSHIKDLYKPIIHKGEELDLKKFVLSLTFPLVPPKDEHGNQVCLDENGEVLLDRDGFPKLPERLITDCCRNMLRGKDSSSDHCFIAPKNRHSLAKSVIDNLPAFVYFYLGQLPDGWFHETAKVIVKRITFYTDEDGDWHGDWTSEADDEAKALIMEDMGMGMSAIIEDLHLVDDFQAPQMPLLRPGDNMSTGTGVDDFSLNDRPTLPADDDDNSTIASDDAVDDIDGPTSASTGSQTQQPAGSVPLAADGSAGHSVTGAAVN